MPRYIIISSVLIIAGMLWYVGTEFVLNTAMVALTGAAIIFSVFGLQDLVLESGTHAIDRLRAQAEKSAADWFDTKYQSAPNT